MDGNAVDSLLQELHGIPFSFDDDKPVQTPASVQDLVLAIKMVP